MPLWLPDSRLERPSVFRGETAYTVKPRLRKDHPLTPFIVCFIICTPIGIFELKQGLTVSYTPLELGRFLTLNGSSDSIDTLSDGVLGTSERTSIINGKTTSSGNAVAICWGSDFGPENGRTWQQQIENGVPYLRVFGGATSYSATSLNDGLMHSFAITALDSATLADTECFIDGQSVGAGSGTRSIDTLGDNKVSLGVQYRSDISDVFIAGDYGYAIVFNKVLSASAIHSLHKNINQLIEPA